MGQKSLNENMKAKRGKVRTQFYFSFTILTRIILEEKENIAWWFWNNNENNMSNDQATNMKWVRSTVGPILSF